jgi:RNA polymerase sigma-70 factor (ECF subfamily)
VSLTGYRTYAHRPDTERATRRHCPGTGIRVSVTGVEGSDALLAARLAAGDDHALAEVFDRLAPAAYGAALGVLGAGPAAEDVVQDVFVELWTRPDQYDPSAGPLRAYLGVLARNRAVDVLRSELRRAARQQRHEQLVPPQPCPSPAEQVLAADTVSRVQAAVRLLPEAQRRVVELAYFGGMTCREVAAAVGIPEGTVKSRLRLALGKLAAALDRQLLEPS